MRLQSPLRTATILLTTALLAACNMPTATPASSASQSVPTLPPPEPVGECNNALQPVVRGARWTYAMSGITTGTFTRTISAVRTNGFTDQDAFEGGVTRSGEWKCEDGTLTALSPAEGLSAMIQTQGMTAQFQTTNSSGITLPAVVAPGTSWTQNFTIEGSQTVGGTKADSRGDMSYSCTAAGTETVVVAAGSFDAVRVGCQINGTITANVAGVEVPAELTSAATIWYARGVGMVRTENEISGIGHSSIELTSYSIP